MALASVQRRDALQVKVRAARAGEAELSAPVAAHLTEWVEKFDDAAACDTIYKALEPLLAAERATSPLLESIYHSRSMLTKNSQWIIGGDGWAYDIGFGGLDHVLARARERQHRRARHRDVLEHGRPGVEVDAAVGARQVRDVGEGAGEEGPGAVRDGVRERVRRVVRARRRLLADGGGVQGGGGVRGDVLLLCYSPCIDWGIDMAKMMEIQKMAVDCGYWPLYRYNPASIAAGDNAFSLDSKRIKSSLATYLQNENRYASLRRTNVERADYLQGEFEASTVKRAGDEPAKSHATPHSPYLTPHIPHIYR